MEWNERKGNEMKELLLGFDNNEEIRLSINIEGEMGHF